MVKMVKALLEWPKDIPQPDWWDMIEPLSVEDACTLAALGLDVRGWWFVGSVKTLLEFSPHGGGWSVKGLTPDHFKATPDNILADNVLMFLLR